MNFAVQVTIDRIIFLRMCEDRGIEPTGQLMALLNGTEIYARLRKHFNDADDRYNSGLFHFHKEKDREEAPDELTPGLAIDDKVLKDIFESLYEPHCPYEFSVLPAEILGQVYEQFLGKVIRLTHGHQAKVEDKPEVKKAGGVYYTPTYIVDYIVKNTVGKLLEGKKASQVTKLTILDPACGSGSFLLGAFQYLLDWHRQYYLNDDPANHTKELYQARGGFWRLTTREKKRILINNIYGVDIDPQAVEVTKLSLLLKVLEGESQETLATQLRIWHERALPDLASNIKCGNSLIGPDFYEGRQLEMFDDEERYRINVFDWNAAFPKIMKSGSFDAVIGNPPSIFTRELLTEPEREYFSARFKASWEKHNTFMLFMELMYRILSKTGRGGFIVPNSWLTIESAKILRSLLGTRIDTLADLNYTVFPRVSMEPCIFIAVGSKLTTPVQAIRANSTGAFLGAFPLLIDRKQWSAPNSRFTFSLSIGATAVIDKLVNESRTIGEVFEVRTGLQAYEEGKGNPPQSASDVENHVFDRPRREDEHSVRYLEGKDVGRYCLEWSGMWMQYGPWLSQPREFGMFSRPRILLREITGKEPYCLSAMYVTGEYLNNKSILNVLHSSDDEETLKALLCLLNSKLISAFYKEKAVKSARLIFPKVVIKNLREFPYPRKVNPLVTKSLAHLAQVMLALRKEIAAAKTPHGKTVLQAQIEATDGCRFRHGGRCGRFRHGGRRRSGVRALHWASRQIPEGFDNAAGRSRFARPWSDQNREIEGANQEGNT